MTFQNVVLRDVYHHLALFKILNHLHSKMLEWVPPDVGQVVGKEVLLTALVTLLSSNSSRIVVLMGVPF